MTDGAGVVLDASLTLAWALPDEASKYSDGVLRAVAAGKAYAPGIWVPEVANGLLTAQRRGRLSEAQRAAFVEQLLRLPIEVEPASAHAALHSQLALAEKHGLTAYDSAYLDLAMRRGVPLATQDRAMKAAAKKAGVRIG